MELILEKSKDGHNVLKVKKDGKERFVGSKYNQRREYEKFISDFKIDELGYTYTVIGLGSIEVIEFLEKEIGEEKILVLEFNNEVLNIYSKELEKYKNNNRIKIIKNKEELISILKNINIEKLKTLCFGNYNKIFNIETIEMFNTLKTYVEKRIVDRNTMIHFGDMWTENDLKNSRYIHISKKIDELKGKYENKPCILVAAGPSLNKNIKDIDKEKAYIVSGGRTLNSLIQQDKEPDFVVIIDGGKISYDLVKENIRNIKAPLIYTETTNHEIVEKHIGTKIVTAKYGFMKNILKEVENIAIGGSVANSMAYAAAYLGFNPIIFVGQDLAYTDNKGHAEIARTLNQSVEGEKGYFKENDLYVEDVYGNKVRTSIEFMQFLRSMEEVINKFPKTCFIDATEGGAKINGTEIRKLKDVMEKLDKISEKKEIVIKENLEVKKYIDRKIEDQIKNINILIEECKKGVDAINKLTQNTTNNNLINKLEQIDNKIKIQIKKNDILEHKLFKIINNLENNERYKIYKSDGHQAKKEKNMMRNKEFYIDMIKISEEVLKLLKNK